MAAKRKSAVDVFLKCQRCCKPVRPRWRFSWQRFIPVNFFLGQGGLVLRTYFDESDWQESGYKQMLQLVDKSEERPRAMNDHLQTLAGFSPEETPTARSQPWSYIRTKHWIWIFIAPLRVSRLRVSADSQVQNEQQKNPGKPWIEVWSGWAGKERGPYEVELGRREYWLKLAAG